MIQPRREGEMFTASTDCPECGVMDVHWLDGPRFEPTDPTPVQIMNEHLHEVSLMTSVIIGGRRIPPRLYDPPGTVVARICKSCGHRWGQR